MSAIGLKYDIQKIWILVNCASKYGGNALSAVLIIIKILPEVQSHADDEILETKYEDDADSSVSV